MAAAPPLKVAEIPGRGRALVALQPLKAGQVILNDSPLLLYSAMPFGSNQQCKYCCYCFRTLQSSSVHCPANPRHLFCNPNCLSMAVSSTHSPWVCQSLSNLESCPQLIGECLDRQAQARFLVAAYNLAALSPSDFQTLLSLQGSIDAIDAGTAQFLHSVISSLCASSKPVDGFSVELTAALLAKDKLNAFGLMEQFSENKERSVRAYGIYPKASFFNHDCLPNACRFDYVDSASDRNTDIIVRMIHDVPEGREICLSYFPVNENYKSRQKRLSEDYGFVCECDRCKVEANWSDDEDGEKEGEDVMGEDDGDDDDDEMVASDAEIEAEAEGEGESDFPHAYFFMRYMCNMESCGGTLAPLPPSPDGRPSNVMECNVCGCLRNADDDIENDEGEGSHLMDE